MNNASSIDSGFSVRYDVRFENGHLGWLRLRDGVGAGMVSPGSPLGQLLRNSRPGDVLVYDPARARTLVVLAVRHELSAVQTRLGSLTRVAA